jgi:pseudouridine synthase
VTAGAGTSELRLQKLLARAGVASRRRAEVLIRAGRVSVNGAVVEEMGTKIDPEKDVVTVDGRPIQAAEPAVTAVLYKPPRVVTTMRDPEGRPTVAGLVSGEPFRLLPVGRLDFHTEGALLLTTDGELANRLLHPRYRVPKTYQVKVGGRPGPEALERLRSGVELDGGATEAALVEVLEAGPRHTWLELIITEGKKQQLPRMLEAIGHRPLRIVRVAFSTIAVEGMKPGQYRYLDRDELAGLYRLVGLPRPSELPEEVRGRGLLGAAQRRRGTDPGEVGEAPRSNRSPLKRRR